MISDSDYEELRARLSADLNSQFAPNTISSEVDRLSGWKRKMVADGSLGRVFNGAQWLDGVAIRDGVISGAKLKATLVISNTFTTADTDVTPTADRVTITSAGIKAYGTVSGVPNTQTLNIGNNGDFTFGDLAHNPISYVASTHTLTVPAAVIGSLTIANVGGGVLGGTYKTASGTGARLEFDTAGFRAYNGSNTKTFDAVASSGDLSLTGNLTVGTAGRINFGASGLDYLSDSVLHLDAAAGSANKIEFKSGTNTPYAQIGSVSSATVGDLSIVASDGTRSASLGLTANATQAYGTYKATKDGTHYAQLQPFADANGGTVNAEAFGANGSTSVYAWASSTAANSGVYVTVNSISVATFAATNRALSLYGRLYPGTGSAAQASRYLYDNGTETEFIGSVKMLNGIYGGAYFPGNQATRYFSDNGAQLYASAGLQSGGAFYPTGQTSIFFDKNAGTGNARIKGANLELPDGNLQQVNFGAASGALAAATKYMPVFDLAAGALRYIPCYTSPGPWTA